jgi:hypothetical protein
MDETIPEHDRVLILVVYTGTNPSFPNSLPLGLDLGAVHAFLLLLLIVSLPLINPLGSTRKETYSLPTPIT